MKNRYFWSTLDPHIILEWILLINLVFRLISYFNHLTEQNLLAFAQTFARETQLFLRDSCSSSNSKKNELYMSIACISPYWLAVSLLLVQQQQELRTQTCNPWTAVSSPQTLISSSKVLKFYFEGLKNQVYKVEVLIFKSEDLQLQILSLFYSVRSSDKSKSLYCCFLK